MSFEELIKKIEKLPIDKKLVILEQTMESIKRHKNRISLEEAAEVMKDKKVEKRDLT